MTDLRWVKPPEMLRQLANASVPNGSHVAIEGTGYKNLTLETIRVLRAYTPFIHVIRTIGRMSAYADLNDTIPVHELKGTNGAIRSEVFPLTARGFLHTQRWICQDPTGTLSPLLRTSRFVDVSIEDLSPQIRSSKVLRLRARIAAPKDPNIELSIVSPSEPSDRCSFSDILDSYTDEALVDSPETIVDEAGNLGPLDFFRKETDGYRSEPPGWQAWIAEPRELTLNSGDEASIEILVLPGSPGMFPFAVLASDKDSSNFSVSNIVVLEQGADGSFKMLFGEGQSIGTQPDRQAARLSPYRLMVEADVFNEDKAPRGTHKKEH